MTQAQQLIEQLQAVPLLPVVTLSDPCAAPVVTRVLAEAGFAAIEVVLRTPAALEALRTAAAESAGLLVGAGTVVSPQLLDSAHAAGARFAISPGYSAAIGRQAQSRGLAWIPGAATATEVQQAAADGLEFLKFFPAESAGGPGWLRAMEPVFPGTRFCPTGGVNARNLADYLALANVPVAGGSWFVRDADRAANQPDQLLEAARAALLSANSHKKQ